MLNKWEGKVAVGILTELTYDMEVRDIETITEQTGKTVEQKDL